MSSVSGNTANKLLTTTLITTFSTLQRAEPSRSHRLVPWQSQDLPCPASSSSCKQTSHSKLQLPPPRNCGNDNGSTRRRHPNSQSLFADVLFLVHRCPPMYPPYPRPQEPQRRFESALESTCTRPTTIHERGPNTTSNFQTVLVHTSILQASGFAPLLRTYERAEPHGSIPGHHFTRP